MLPIPPALPGGSPHLASAREPSLTSVSNRRWHFHDDPALNWRNRMRDAASVDSTPSSLHHLPPFIHLKRRADAAEQRGGRTDLTVWIDAESMRL